MKKAANQERSKKSISKFLKLIFFNKVYPKNNANRIMNSVTIKELIKKLKTPTANRKITIIRL